MNYPPNRLFELHYKTETKRVEQVSKLKVNENGLTKTTKRTCDAYKFDVYSSDAADETAIRFRMAPRSDQKEKQHEKRT